MSNTKWIDPETLGDSVKKVKGNVLCKKYYHKAMGELIAIPNNNVEGNYELMNVWGETDTCYYGSPVEGLGLINCMILKEDCRAFTDNEIRDISKITIGIYGCTRGKLSYVYGIDIVDLVGKRREEAENSGRMLK